MDHFMHSFGVFAFSLLTLGSVHTHHVAPLMAHDGDKDTHHENIQMVHAVGSLSQFGQTISIALTFPKNGGDVNGTITGACTGDIHGSFNGYHDQKGTLKGSAHANCTVLFTTINGSATFKGPVDLEDKSISLDADVTGAGVHQDTTLHLTIK